MSSFTERAKLPPLHYHYFQLQTMNLPEFAALNDGSRLYRTPRLFFGIVTGAVTLIKRQDH